MGQPTPGQRIWGWYFFDWASQPYNTLLITFIFGPYIAELLGDGARAQTVWSFGIGCAGVIIALLSPVLGAVADAGGRRMAWVWLFSALYVIGSAGLWWAAPGDLNLWLILSLFAIGLIGMEFATTFTNAWLPELAPPERIGRLSGSGWAFGYLGGFVALLIMLAFFAEDAQTGTTFIGIAPLFGLDPALREGTRFVGPLTAIWYVVFMVPFFLWLRDPPRAAPRPGAIRRGLADLRATLSSLPHRRSLSAFLLGSMFYRDALNAIYGIGGVYAAGVLGWKAMDAGVFGIAAILSGVVFTWAGGRADERFGPKAVIVASGLVLVAVVIVIATVSREAVLGLRVAPGSTLPDMTFLMVGVLIGAAGGSIQAASRTMMVRLAEPGRMTEAFGLYALTGKATSFVAPLLVGAATWISGSQQIGVLPLLVLFLLGLVLLVFVRSGDAGQE